MHKIQYELRIKFPGKSWETTRGSVSAPLSEIKSWIRNEHSASLIKQCDNYVMAVLRHARENMRGRG